MNGLSLLSFLLFLNFCSQAQTQNPHFDEELAKTLGADDYGMKMYIFVVLKTGKNTSESKSSRDSLFAGHMQNIHRLVEMQKLIVAGPFMKNESDFRGLFILDVSTVEEAHELLDMDPAIKCDLLHAELYNWYGSAALSQYLPDSDKIWKIKP